jgi:hypothetical protein
VSDVKDGGLGGVKSSKLVVASTLRGGSGERSGAFQQGLKREEREREREREFASQRPVSERLLLERAGQMETDEITQEGPSLLCLCI